VLVHKGAYIYSIRSYMYCIVPSTITMERRVAMVIPSGSYSVDICQAWVQPHCKGCRCFQELNTKPSHLTTGQFPHGSNVIIQSNEKISLYMQPTINTLWQICFYIK